MRRLLLFASILLASIAPAISQEKTKVKFGKVSPEDFAPKVYSLDSNANAIIIADIGSTEMVDNAKGGFSLEFKNYRRARIINKNGYDVANVTIGIFTQGDNEEELATLKAVTYNLENGKVVETKLETKSSVFKDRINKNLVIKKFTFPNVKEGSIIEYEYKLKSDFIFNLQPWEFQGDYPRLWSQYTVSMPEFYYYVTLTQGYQPFYIKDKKDRVANFAVSDTRAATATDRTTFSAGVTDFRFIMKDVPALKEESFTSTIQNHIAKIQFQLSEIRYPFTPRNVMGSWTKVSEDLLKDEDFGLSLNKENGWLNDVMKAAVGPGISQIEKARQIYSYVRDNFTCTNRNRLYLEQPLKSVLRSRNGNEAEINLLLIAMLRKAGVSAEPVMLSTKSHGYAFPAYPMLDRFNYVISQATIDGQEIYLDASQPRMGFGKLYYDCYNGHARIINNYATPIELRSDSLMERKLTSIFIINDEKGNFSGSLQQQPGYYESSRIRSVVKEKGMDQLTSNFKKGFSSEVEISDAKVDSLNKYEEPVAIKYSFLLKHDNSEDIIYFNPMLNEAYKENPFKSAVRLYPVEMPYAMDETYLLQLGVPEGYVIDEMPKQIMVKLNEDGDGFFEYRVSESNGTISLRSRLKLTRSYYQPEEYDMLREFFNLVVKKHGEQIVFKKKK